jgi:hypothetical protein
MTTRTINNDTLLSLWSLEQNFYQNESTDGAITFLFSGGQDSSTLAWFLHHTEPSRPRTRHLVHCAHLLQQDNFFMAQQAVNLSFWLGWRHTTIFSTQHLSSEKGASCWRASVRHRVGVYVPAQLVVNGHTETDKRESDFFQFIRTSKCTHTFSADSELVHNSSAYSTLALSYTGTRHENEWYNETQHMGRVMQNAASAHLTGTVTKMSTGGNSVMAKAVRRPLSLLMRKDTRLFTASQRLPIYPDQTNFECQTTRAQIRYSVFPLLAKLGFTFFK